MNGKKGEEGKGRRERKVGGQEKRVERNKGSTRRNCANQSAGGKEARGEGRLGTAPKEGWE